MEPTDTRYLGVVVDLTFQNPQTGYAVARLEVEGCAEPVRIVGGIPGLSLGDTLEVRGAWTKHAKYGKQFSVESYEFRDPATERGVLRYLASGAIPGIRTELAERLVARFGANTLRVMDEEPQRLREVKGIGKKRLQKIRDVWDKQRGQRRALIFLQGHGLGTAMSARVFAQYGTGVVPLVRKDPFRLMWEVDGVGFRTADRVAHELGMAADHPSRIEAGVHFSLDAATQEGHVFLPRTRLAEQAAAVLGCALPEVEAAVDRLVARGDLVTEEDRVYLRALHAAETGCARHLLRLLSAPTGRPAIDAARAIEWVERQIRFRLGEEQRHALATALGNKVCVITGGPGVGKTTLLIALQRIFEKKKLLVGLCAPTGRAARRMAEATGRNAGTIHRTLAYSAENRGFEKGEDDPLKFDVLIVDETSMVDVALFRSLLAALPDRASLILVGDADQLPSVGPGQVLRDVIESGRAPVVNLRHVYRQAEGSGIIEAAHRVLAGQAPRTASRKSADAGALPDFHFVAVDDPERCADMILKLCTERIPARYGFDALRDVQVLSPIYRGDAGVDRLNERLQAALNPPPPSEEPPAPMRAGDKVMQLRNDYEEDVFNGDVGRVVDVSRTDRMVRVRFDAKEVNYGVEGLADLTLAYACTIHKSQGSEYPAVVIALLQQHYMMLNRNLLYTALTRGKKLVVIVGSPRALARAVETASAARRFTGLGERLKAQKPGEHHRGTEGTEKR